MDRFTAAQGRQHAQLDDKQWSGPFFFMVLADPQLGLLHKDEKWTEYGSLWFYSHGAHVAKPTLADDIMI